MKKLFILFTFLSTVAYGQEFYLVPKELIDMVRESKVGPGLIQLKGQTLDTVIYADGNHYYLIASGDGNNAPGTKIRVQIKQVPMTEVPVDTIPTVVIDTVDAALSTFSAGWTHSKSTTAKWVGGTMSFSNIKDSYATYKHPVAYRRIEIWSERKNTHGSIELRLDGGNPIIWDLYNPTYEIPYLAWAFDVPMGVHELKIRITGEKRAESINAYGLIDFYKIYR